MRAHTYARPWLPGSKVAVPILLAFLLAFGVAARAEDPVQPGGSKIKVLTYNVYCGTTFSGATDPDLAKFRQNMTQALLDVRASDPAGRAQAVAREIVAYSPHFVSLQEVFTVSSGTSKDTLALEFDYLELLQQALAAQGASYSPVQSVTTWDATVPSTLGYLRATWRIVILMRTDLPAEQFVLTNVDGNRFATVISFPLPALNGSADCPVALTGTGSCVMPWPRGWAFADVTYRGRQFRYVNATLESNSNSRNIAQGLELLNGPLNTTRSTILAGDLNCDLSNPSDPRRLTCTRILDAGFQDAWGVAKSSNPGFTKELPNMTMRSDYVMTRGVFHAQSAALVGDSPADWTATGLWPSNHAGVVVKLDRP